METETAPTLIDQLFDLLEQVILPDWNGVIRLVPLLFVVVVVVFLILVWWMWRRQAQRNRPRLPRPSTGTPPPGVHLPGPSRWPFVVPIGAALLLFALVPARNARGEIIGTLNPLLLVIGLIVLIVAFIGWLRDANREWRSTAQATAATAGVLGPGTVPEGQLGTGGAAATLGPGGYQPEQVRREPPEGVHLPGPSPWPFFAPIAITILFFGVIFSPALIIGGLVLGAIAAGGWLRDAGREYRSTEAVGHAVPATADPRQAWPRRLVPIFAVVIALSVLVTLVPVGIGWVNGLAPAGPSATALAVPDKPEITARTAASFETTTLLVPCCQPFELVFHNEQAGVPHSVKIGDSAALTNVLFDGDEISGVADITYQVPQLAQGDYYFLCRVHPNMNGTLQARPGSGPPGPGSGPPGPGSGPPGSGAPAGPAGAPGGSPGH